MSWPLGESLDDAQLERRLFPAPVPSRVPRAQPPYAPAGCPSNWRRPLRRFHIRDPFGKLINILSHTGTAGRVTEG